MGNKSTYPTSLKTLTKLYTRVDNEFSQSSILDIESHQCSRSIWRKTETQQLFLVQQLTYSSRQMYEMNVQRLSLKQESQSYCQSQNTLKLVKVWTEEHNSVCSSVFKIYPMYQFYAITLQDQIKARKQDSKIFEEQQILSIVQSCVNAIFENHKNVLISPKDIYIGKDGLLKLINEDLFNISNCFQSFKNNIFYAPEKMLNFQSVQCNQKQLVFSLGLSILSCLINEQDHVKQDGQIFNSLYDPFNQDKKKRFNQSRLNDLLLNVDQMQTLSCQTKNIIISMLVSNPKQRCSLQQIQYFIDKFSYSQTEQQHSQRSNIRTSLTQNQAQKGKQIIKETNIQGVISPINQLNLMPSYSIPNQNFIQKKEQQNLVQLNRLFPTSTIQLKRTHQQTQEIYSSQLQILRQILGDNNIRASSTLHPLQTHVVNDKLQKTCENNQYFFDIDPICKENSLFTNPEFLLKMKNEIANYSCNKLKRSSLLNKKDFIQQTLRNQSQKVFSQTELNEAKTFRTGCKKSNVRRIL